MSEVDPLVEPIEAYALLLQHTRRPDSAYTLEPAQIPFLLDLSEVYCGQRIFPRGSPAFRRDRPTAATPVTICPSVALAPN
jgi:hypothetical protein